MTFQRYRLHSSRGLAFSSVIWIPTLVEIYGEWAATNWFPVMWNAILHLPPLVICTYYFLIDWKEGLSYPT